MRVMRLKEKYPTAKVELWCEDEHRLGLKPIVRKVWSPVGERPSVKVHQRYEWSYLYSFVRLFGFGSLRQGSGSGQQKKAHPVGA